MTTALTIANDHLIRALYAAKEELKKAASEWKTAEHNLADAKADRSTDQADFIRIKNEDEAAYERYFKVEKTYDVIHAACSKLNLI